MYRHSNHACTTKCGTSSLGIPSKPDAFRFIAPSAALPRLFSSICQASSDEHPESDINFWLISKRIVCISESIPCLSELLLIFNHLALWYSACLRLLGR